MIHTNEPVTGGEHPKTQRRKLHQDWRLWLMVVLMLAAMAVYLLTLDLR